MATETVQALLAKALKRREELRIEAEALETLIDTYRKLDGLREQDRQTDQLDLWKGSPRRAFRSANVAAMLDAARRIILSERRPMKRGELVTRLEAQGFVIEGGDKSKVFGTNVWRSNRFRHIEGKGYWPLDVPLAEIRPGRT